MMMMIYYNIRGPPSYMRSVFHRNVVMWLIPVLTELTRLLL